MLSKDPGRSRSRSDSTSQSSAMTAREKSDHAEVAKLAKRHFGHRGLRPLQGDIIPAMLRGENVVATLPTGGGKSLCYQLPAVILPGVTVVVSPLISLMHDQLKGLREQNIAAVALDSHLSDREYDEALKLIRAGEVKLVYVSPERLITKKFLDGMQGVHVNRLAVDEAHCISSWGHDFRPEYMKIPLGWERLGKPPIAAFTATAPVLVREEIITSLGMGDCQQFHADVDRPNIELSIVRFNYTGKRLESLVEKVQDAERRGMSTIVFTLRIKTVDEICERFQKAGIDFVKYHGQMEPDDRKRAQEAFMSDKVPIMVATSAFGMGNDKPNIRRVYHVGVPASLEEYYQQVGRGGRDGLPTIAELLYVSSDIRDHRRFMRAANPSLSYIENMFERLAKFVLPSEWNSSNPPKRQIYWKKFYEDFKGTESMARAAIALLERHGLITTTPTGCIFHAKPKSARNGAPFALTEAEINLKKLRDELRFKIMLEYTEENANLRGTILEHFNSNGIAERVARTDILDYVHIPTDRLKAMLEIVSRREINPNFITAGVNAERARLDPDPFEDMSGNQISFEFEYLEQAAMIYSVPVGTRRFYVLTQKGISELEFHGVKPFTATNVTDLLKAMASPTHRQMIEAQLRPWLVDRFEKTSSRGQQTSDLEAFLGASFQFFGEKVSGKRLAESFCHLPRNRKAGPYDAKTFINFIFPQKVP